MPFNVNPPCVAPQKTNITWQFPGQPEKSNSQGDDYRVYYAFSPTSPRVIAEIRWNASLFRTDGSSSPCFNVNSYTEPNRRSTYVYYVRELPVNPLDLFVQNPTYISNGVPVYVPGLFKGWTLQVKTYASATNNTHSIKTVQQGVDDQACYIVPGSLRNGEYVFQPSNGVKCVIDIYKNGQVIASDFNSTMPVVSYTCGLSCPSNTCDVLCGNTICCYNSDGISVSNYPNT